MRRANIPAHPTLVNARPHIVASYWLVQRSLADFLVDLADRSGPIPELCKLRGFHNLNLFEDILHDDLLGLRHELSGSALYEPASEQAFGPPPPLGPWQTKMDVQLAVATRQFRAWCKAHGKNTSQVDFRVLNLSMHTLKDWPSLKGKANNSAIVSEWLCHIASAHIFDERSEMRSVCLQSAVDIWHLIQDTKFPDWVLSKDQMLKLESSRLKCLLGYEWLSKDSYSKSLFRYKLIPKFHHWEHGLRRSVRTSISPSVTYTFSPEDFMGVTSRMCAKVHGSTILKRGVSRWLISFFAALE